VTGGASLAESRGCEWVPCGDVALADFNRGDFNRAGLTKEEDLFPFCARLRDAKLIASNMLGATMGTDIRILQSGGVNTGQQVYDAMMKPEGVISEVNYLWPKAGTTAPLLPKTSLVTRVSSDLGCASVSTNNPGLLPCGAVTGHRGGIFPPWRNYDEEIATLLLRLCRPRALSRRLKNYAAEIADPIRAHDLRQATAWSSAGSMPAITSAKSWPWRRSILPIS
jgi:hypothetical protein